MYTEAVLGYRSWHIDASTYRLRSPVLHQITDAVWPIGGPIKAKCIDTRLSQRRLDDLHDAPTMGCVCGLRAWHTFDLALKEHSSADLAIVGAALCWGRMVVATSGLKAEYMRPLAFVDHRASRPLGWSSLLESMIEMYSVPLLPRDLLEAYAETWAKPMGIDFTP